MIFFPIIEAAEQTVMQAVVPYEQQGRVFGFAQSIESMATPITTFLIGPIAAFIFIPFMTTGSGVALIGSWFGTGADRGMALVFIFAGLVGVLITCIAWGSRSYRELANHYKSS
jgi:DHA3 family multidrug efflux protein-like MFS transporter